MHISPTRILLSHAILALVLFSGPSLEAQEAGSQARTDEEAGPALWEFRLAAFGRHAPVYPGADESDVSILPIPFPVYRGSFLRFGESLDQIARGEISETKRVRIGIDLDFTFGEDSNDVGLRRGMPDLDFLLEVGPEVEVRLTERTPEQGELFFALQLRAGISLDGLEPSVRGYLVNPELEYRRDRLFGGENLLSLRLKPTWASEDYMDYYYEVDPAYASMVRPAYDAMPGFLGTKFTAALTRQINDRLVLGASASYSRFSGAVNDISPLFGRNSETSLQVALVWTLAESVKRAKTRSE